MHMRLFVEGFLVGLVLCAPVGPVGLLCVRKTLAEGRAAGLAAVLGAATADGLYCSVAGLGIGFVATFLKHEEFWLELFGGAILILIGTRIYLSLPSEEKPSEEGRGLLRTYTSTFLLMLANPMPILVFTAAFTALGVRGWTEDGMSTAKLVAGVFSGSAIWSPILVLAVGRFHPEFRPVPFHLVNKITGTIILGLGVALVTLTVVGPRL
jgi:threonine/homoserine/homoserine lactone efflux protein